MSIPPSLQPIYVQYDDFINSFDGDEASELSHLNLPEDRSIARAKVEYQLALAEKKWLSWFGLKPTSNLSTAPVECTENLITCSCAIARYRMDYLNARETVRQAYEDCEQLAYLWRKEQLELKKQDKAVTTEPVMSIFTV